MEIISFEDFSFTYAGKRYPALQDFFLSVSKGQSIAILGAGGSGKSTLCRLITGFAPSFFKGSLSGSCRIQGRDIQKWSVFDLHRLSGYLFQNTVNQLSHVKFSVRDEIAFGLENLGVAPRDMAARVDGVMRKLGIEHIAHRDPQTLSGGELQKVSLGAVLVMEPEILVLDEPLTYLDPAAAEQIEKLFLQLNRSGCTIVITQNEFNTFTSCLDMVVLLNRGRPIAVDKPSNVLNFGKLEKFGVTPPAFHASARMAKEQALWPANSPLPTTLAEALAGFKEIMEMRPV